MVLPRARTVLLGVLGLIGLVVLVERLVVTDREAIESMLEEGRDAARDHEFARLRPLFSDEFRWGELGPDQALARLEALVAGHAVVVDAKWGPIEPVGDRCEVEVSVTVFRTALFPVRVVFAREPGGWKVREVRSA